MAGTFVSLGTHLEFVWVTRSWAVTPVSPGETFSRTGRGGNRGLRLSPDGSRVAFTNERDGNLNIWTKTLSDGIVSLSPARPDFADEDTY